MNLQKRNLSFCTAAAAAFSLGSAPKHIFSAIFAMAFIQVKQGFSRGSVQMESMRPHKLLNGRRTS
jgi:hypothetical protein